MRKLDATLKKSFVADEDESFRGILCSNRQSDAHEFLTLLWKKLEDQAPET